jgi:hypothetical protein
MISGKLSVYERPTESAQELERAAHEKGWPDGLMKEALELRVPRYDLDWWLTHDEPSVDEIGQLLERRRQLMFGTIRVREATSADDEALAELYANSPEDIGDWEVTVERSPYPFAQFRLQEHANIQVLEDRGVIIAATAHSGRNTIFEGKRVTVHIATAWRVRKEFRGRGYSRLLQMGAGPACAWFGMLKYWYTRSGNFDSVNWITAVRPGETKGPREEAGALPGMPVSVHHFVARPFDDDAAGIRRVKQSDVRSCVSLINGTQHGLDLFRPYSEDSLRMRLDDPCWGPKPDSWMQVYGWKDYFVLEDDGRIIACAGLWDRGRHMREVWRHKETGERHVIERTALIDFGFTEGREDAMERLLAFLMGRTHDLGRRELMAPIEQLPELVERMAPYEPGIETRAMRVDAPRPEDEGKGVDVSATRPYTDLAYW